MQKTQLIVIFVCFLIACKDEEIGKSKDVNPETIYTKYTVNYTEGDAMVQSVATFRFAGENGTTLVLSEPSSIMLDEKKLQVDSAKYSGAYYKHNSSLENFIGNHVWIFTNTDKKIYKQPFEFTSFKIAKPIAGFIQKQNNLEIEFEGLKEAAEVMIKIADTAFKTSNIDKLMTIQNKKVSISSAELSALSNGPLTIDIRQHSKQNVSEGTSQGGDIEQTYSLKRIKVMLKD